MAPQPRAQDLPLCAKARRLEPMRCQGAGQQLSLLPRGHPLCPGRPPWGAPATPGSPDSGEPLAPGHLALLRVGCTSERLAMSLTETSKLTCLRKNAVARDEGKGFLKHTKSSEERGDWQRMLVVDKGYEELKRFGFLEEKSQNGHTHIITSKPQSATVIAKYAIYLEAPFQALLCQVEENCTDHVKVQVCCSCVLLLLF
ncbi:hypothetical protein Nmel_001208 [Mimus melanotis]